MPIDVHRARLQAIRTHDVPQTIEILDRYGRPIAEIAKDGYRVWLPLRGIPEAVRRAVIATEDRTFYHNGGVDKKAVARAALQNASAGGTVSGASTITMQLVRLVAFEPSERLDRSIERKAREAYLAAELDERFSKDELLEAYLNIAYFGRRAYGIEAAAERFFGRHAIDLDVAQSTFLAGLLQAPTAYDPDVALPAAKARQRTVLDALVAVDRMDGAAADAAYAERLAFVTPPPPPPRQVEHFVDYVTSELPRVLGAARPARRLPGRHDRRSGAHRRRARDRRAAGRVLRAAHDVGDAAVVVLDPRTGEIRAMVGGVRYDDPASGQVNMAVEPRQPGSSFKPLTYAAALASGWSPASVVWDVPSRFGTEPNAYQPANSTGVYRGPVRLRRALANSLNASAVNLLSEVGVERVHAMAVALGLPLDPDPWHYGLSLTLGGGEVPLYRPTSALATFGNEAGTCPPPASAASRTRDGRRALGESGLGRPAAVGRHRLAHQRHAQRSRRPHAGLPAAKPARAAVQGGRQDGTTNDFRDNLTVGWTTYLAVGVWTGQQGRPSDARRRRHHRRRPDLARRHGPGARRPEPDGGHRRRHRPGGWLSAARRHHRGGGVRAGDAARRWRLRPAPGGLRRGPSRRRCRSGARLDRPADRVLRPERGRGRPDRLFLPPAGPIRDAANAWARAHGTPLAPPGCTAAGRRIACR
ncbi:MAG: transglycosylase domain-containing protein [Anaerolineae bacterium]